MSVARIVSHLLFATSLFHFYLLFVPVLPICAQEIESVAQRRELKTTWKRCGKQKKKTEGCLSGQASLGSGLPRIQM